MQRERPSIEFECLTLQFIYQWQKMVFHLLLYFELDEFRFNDRVIHGPELITKQTSLKLQMCCSGFRKQVFWKHAVSLFQMIVSFGIPLFPMLNRFIA